MAAGPHALSVVFLCTGNSCRSQMAEGFARAMKGDSIEAHSAGLRAKGLDPRAVRAMAEAGVDISGQTSNALPPEDPALEGVRFDVVVTVCGHADETCPAWVRDAARVVRVPFDDPPKLAEGASHEEEAMAHYRRVRDEIREFIETLPGSLAPPGS